MTDKIEYSALVKSLARKKIKRAQFPIQSFVDARGVEFVMEIKTGRRKWKSGKGGTQTRGYVKDVIYKRKR